VAERIGVGAVAARNPGSEIAPVPVMALGSR
jgi:hypothetical protein